jgi:hypothetical protein
VYSSFPGVWSSFPLRVYAWDDVTVRQRAQPTTSDRTMSGEEAYGSCLGAPRSPRGRLMRAPGTSAANETMPPIFRRIESVGTRVPARLRSRPLTDLFRGKERGYKPLTSNFGAEAAFEHSHEVSLVQLGGFLPDLV